MIRMQIIPSGLMWKPKALHMTRTKIDLSVYGDGASPSAYMFLSCPKEAREIAAELVGAAEAIEEQEAGVTVRASAGVVK